MPSNSVMSERPTRVLYVIHDARRGGVQSVMLRVIAALDRKRVEPTVMFPFDGPCARELRQQGVRVIAVGRQTPFFWRLKRFSMMPRLLKLAKQADIVHLNSVKLAIPSLAVSLFGGRGRTVFHLHELPGKIGPLLRAAMRRADCAAFCSQTCADHFFDVGAQKRAVLINALPLPDREVKTQTGGLPKIVMLGSINHGKGQDLLLDGFALVREQAELHFYGNVGLSARGYVRRLKEQAARTGVASRVFFHPPTDDVAGLLAETALLVHTSRRESFGMVLIEAMAAAVPVIANDLGGMREVVADGVTGYLVEPGNPALLASRIDELLADPRLRQEMGDAGRQRVRERFDIAMRIEDYHKLYQQLNGRER